LFDLVFTRAEQPKVGLVLSGGGAKGFAHSLVLEKQV
jgi:predicted acylesterase/phospholipase RssA